MKNTQFRILALIAGILMSAVTFTACDKDDDKGDPPTIVSLTVANDNATATIAFSEVVYKADNQTGNLDKAAFTVTLAGGTATLADFTVTHTAGTNEVVIGLTLNGIANGSEVLTVKPAAANAVYNAKGAGIDAAQTATANLKDTGIIGKWQSSGVNMAPLLVAAGIDSIYAEFKGDNTYVVESFTPDGSKTTLVGTFTQQRAGVGNIWNITVNQSSPTSLVSVGIFEVSPLSPISMKYEIAQTEPAIAGVTPPTAAAGFGSTSGGAFGIWNIQTYLKIN